MKRISTIQTTPNKIAMGAASVVGVCLMPCALIVAIVDRTRTVDWLSFAASGIAIGLVAIAYVRVFSKLVNVFVDDDSLVIREFCREYRIHIADVTSLATSTILRWPPIRVEYLDSNHVRRTFMFMPSMRQNRFRSDPYKVIGELQAMIERAKAARSNRAD